MSFNKILVFAVLVVVAGGGFLAGTLFVKDKQIFESLKTKFPLIDPARNFIDQEHYIVNIQPLRTKLREMSKEFSKSGREVSVYVEFLNTGGNISINPNTYIWPASLSKVPLALAVMKKVERGEWKLENELVLMQGDADSKSGNLQTLLAKHPIGTRFTIEKLLEELLVNSDNTAFYIFLRNLSQDDLKAVIEGLGIEMLFSEEGKISAKEYSRILRSLYTASLLNRVNSEKILEWLDRSTFEIFLAGPISDEIPFPHKYGEHLPFNVFADSGIVYIADRPYIVSVMIQGKKGLPFEEEKEVASKFMQEVSDVVYKYFLEYKN